MKYIYTLCITHERSSSARNQRPGTKWHLVAILRAAFLKPRFRLYTQVSEFRIPLNTSFPVARAIIVIGGIFLAVC